MTTLTAQEEITLRRKIGNNGAGFSTPDLDSIWVEAEGNMNRAIFICFEELMNNAARFTDYTQNDTQEKRSQIFDHIANKVLPYWRGKLSAAEAGENTTKQTARIVGTKVVPPRRIARPFTDPHIDPYQNPNQALNYPYIVTDEDSM